MNRKVAVPVLLLTAIAGIGLSLRMWPRAEPTSSSGLTVHGQVDVRQVSLAFEGNGRIVGLDVEEGDMVQAGQVVGRIDTVALDLKVKQAQARIQAQKERLARLLNGARPHEIGQARSQLKAAQAEAMLARTELRRVQQIFDDSGGRAISAGAVDAALGNWRAAQARAAALSETLALVREGAREEEVAAARAELAAIEAERDVLAQQVAQGVLVAPADGRVRSRLLEPGDMASSTRPALVLVLSRPKWVRAYVNETDLGRVRPGMAVQVVTDSASRSPVAGRIGAISSVAEFTPRWVQTEDLRTSLVYEVRINVDDSADLLRFGQPVTVHLDVKAHPEVS